MNELVQREPEHTAPNPQYLLSLAVQQGADLEKLERLMALQERWEANEARKAYVAAMAAFKADPIRIVKDKAVSFTTTKGTTAYNHATLGNVVQSIVLGLAKHGLSHSWDTRRVDARVHVKCKITHAKGHSESIELDAALDDSGSKNNIQAMGSTITYLQRYTLLAITGLATEEDDDDGRGAGNGNGENPHAAWLDKIDGIADSLEAEKVRTELKEAFAGDPPKALVQRWQSVAKKFKGAAK